MTSPIIQPAIDAFHQRTPLRVGSLLVTIFGDAVLPYGGFVRLSSLLEITAGIGIDDGAVRVAIHRLEKVGWLKKHKVGRNAHYALSREGEDESRQAAKLIYGFTQIQNPGNLQMLVLNEGAGRAKTREYFVNAGWGLIAPNILLTSGTGQQLAALQCQDNLAEAYLLPLSASVEDVRRLCINGFDLGTLNDVFCTFNQLYNPITDEIGVVHFTAQDALILRVLMIHEYRQLVLKDPCLAPSCMPKVWHGDRTRKLLSMAYPILKERSKNWME